jgi:hypothetical protein
VQQQGTLRQFILNSNAIAGVQTSNFSIGTGAQTITPTAALPPITDATILDATTQEGFGGTPLSRRTARPPAPGRAGSCCRRHPAAGSRLRSISSTGSASDQRIVEQRRIELPRHGFFGHEPAANNTGLVIWGNSTKQHGRRRRPPTQLISGNAVGIQFRVQMSRTTSSSATSSASTGTGRRPGQREPGRGGLQQRERSTIGGTAPGAGNVVSGSNGGGIVIRGVGTTLNAVLGNYVGTNAAGTAAIGSSTVGGNGGISRQGATNNVIGGPPPPRQRHLRQPRRRGRDQVPAPLATASRQLDQSQRRRQQPVANADDGVVIERGRQLHRRHRRRQV